MLKKSNTRRRCAADLALRAAGAGLLLAAGAAAQGNVWYVDDDALPGQSGEAWGPFSAFKDLQDALAVAQPGDEIWVAEGVYRPNVAGGSKLVAFELRPGVKLYGGFLGWETDPAARPPHSAGVESILSGDLNGDDDGYDNRGDNSYNTVRASLTDEDSLLDRFVIEGGNAAGVNPQHYNGAGIYSKNGAFTMRECTLRWNSAPESASSGAGMYVENGDPVVMACRFEDNRARRLGGGLYIRNSSAVLTDCTFLRNDTSDGEVGVGDGGAVYSWGGSPTFVNARFLGNTANLRGGAIYHQNGQTTLINSVLSGNSCGVTGGAIHLTGASGPILNCSFTNNVAGDVGGAIYAGFGAAPDLTANSIFWGNSDSGTDVETAQIHMATASGLPIVWSLVEGWSGPDGPVGGSDIKTSDPLFVNALGPDGIAGTEDDDVSLASGSPGVDAGNNGDVGLDLADLDGDGETLEPTPFDITGAPRIFDDPATPATGSFISGELVVDLGPYEFSGPTTLAKCVTRNGGGINPLDYTCVGPPKLGTTWTATIATPPGTVWTAIAFSAAGPTSGSFALGGELLILPPFATVDTTFGTHAFPLPDNPSWVGIQLYSQGLRFELAAGTVPLNAIDLTLGY